MFHSVVLSGPQLSRLVAPLAIQTTHSSPLLSSPLISSQYSVAQRCLLAYFLQAKHLSGMIC